MAQFTFVLPDFGNTPITIDAEDRDAAVGMLQSASEDQILEAARDSLETRMNRTGLSQEDVEAILFNATAARDQKGTVGHAAGGRGGRFSFIDAGLIGAGRTITSKSRGAMQIMRNRLPTSVADRIRLPSVEQLEEVEAEHRRLFEQIDKGIGMEDVGEILPEALAFFGGGAASVGWKALAAGSAVGASLGALGATTEDESRAFNSFAGATAGALAPALGTTAKTLADLIKAGGGAMANGAAALVAAGQGNAQSTAFALSRMFSRMGAVQGSAERAVAASRAAGETSAGAATMRTLAGRAEEHLGRIIGTMDGEAADSFVSDMANQAFETGFKMAQDGSVTFNPRAVVNSLARVSRREMIEVMGSPGRRLNDFRNWAKTLIDLDDLDAQAVQTAYEAYWSSSEARAMAQAMQRATNPETRKSLLGQMFVIGARSAQAAAAGATTQGTEQVMR